MNTDCAHFSAMEWSMLGCDRSRTVGAMSRKHWREPTTIIPSISTRFTKSPIRVLTMLVGMVAASSAQAVSPGKYLILRGRAPRRR